jgi:hypothetical protein
MSVTMPYRAGTGVGVGGTGVGVGGTGVGVGGTGVGVGGTGVGVVVVVGVGPVVADPAGPVGVGPVDPVGLPLGVAVGLPLVFEVGLPVALPLVSAVGDSSPMTAAVALALESAPGVTSAMMLLALAFGFEFEDGPKPPIQLMPSKASTSTPAKESQNGESLRRLPPSSVCAAATAGTAP